MVNIGIELNDNYVKMYLRDILKGIFKIKKALFKEIFSRHINKFTGVAAFFCIEA